MRRTALYKFIYGAGHHLRRLNRLPAPLHSSLRLRLPNPTTAPNPNPEPCSTVFVNRRFYSEGRESTPSREEMNKAVEEINAKFVEAREEIDLAMESKETVYFNEEAMVAKEAVKEVLDMFDELLERVGEEEKGVLRRSMGMKIEQLKAELDQLNE